MSIKIKIYRLAYYDKKQHFKDININTLWRQDFMLRVAEAGYVVRP